MPRAGAMDLTALRTLNAILGNKSGSAAIEWALTGGALSFSAPCQSLRLAEPLRQCASTKASSSRTAHITASPGDTLAIEPPASGRFLYWRSPGESMRRA